MPTARRDFEDQIHRAMDDFNIGVAFMEIYIGESALSDAARSTTVAARFGHPKWFSGYGRTGVGGVAARSIPSAQGALLWLVR